MLRAECFVRHRHLHLHPTAGRRLGQVREDRVVGTDAEHLRYRAPDQVARLQAETRRIRLVDELEAVRAIAMRDQHRRAVGDEAQLPFAGARVVLCLQQCRDVTIDLEHHAFATRSVERPARIDGDDAAVVAAVEQAPFPGAVALQRLLDRHEGLGKTGLQQAVRDLPDGLRRRPAIGALGAAVPGQDLAVEAPHRDGVVSVVQQDRQRRGIDGFAGRDRAATSIVPRGHRRPLVYRRSRVHGFTGSQGSQGSAGSGGSRGSRVQRVQGFNEPPELPPS